MEHKVEEVKLKCGAKGLLIDVPEAPVFCMDIYFRAGYGKEAEYKKYEVAHIMEHMAFGANAQHKSSAEVSRYIGKYGADFNAWTGADYMGYTRECPDFDWERILRQLVIQLTTPKFIEKEFKSEVGNVSEEMQLRSNEKWTELDKVMDGRFGWKYSETYLERLEMMKSVTLNDIKEHYKSTHGAENAVFFIAGNLSDKKDKIVSILEGLSGLPQSKKIPLNKYPKIKSFANTPVVIRKEDVPNVYMQISAYASNTDIEQKTYAVALGAFNKILSDGDHSKIYGKARKSGLVYSLGCSRSYNENGTYIWSLYCQVGVENIDKLLDLIVKELKDIRKNGLKEKDLKEALVSMKGSLRMGNQTAGKIMHWNSGWYTAHENERVYDFGEVDKWYDDVSPDLIQRLFINLIKTKKWGAGFLGNVTEAQAKKWNKKLAEIFED